MHDGERETRYATRVSHNVQELPQKKQHETARQRKRTTSDKKRQFTVDAVGESAAAETFADARTLHSRHTYVTMQHLHLHLPTSNIYSHIMIQLVIIMHIDAS
jgi:hypothetical protein